jgi:hypothetical protein
MKVQHIMNKEYQKKNFYFNNKFINFNNYLVFFSGKNKIY